MDARYPADHGLEEDVPVKRRTASIRKMNGTARGHDHKGESIFRTVVANSGQSLWCVPANLDSSRVLRYLRHEYLGFRTDTAVDVHEVRDASCNPGAWGKRGKRLFASRQQQRFARRDFLFNLRNG